MIDDVFGELFKTNTIKEGAMFTIEFSPEHGVRLNYDEVGDLPYIKEEGFDQAILRAWLGDHPISLEMKKDLLVSTNVTLPIFTLPIFLYFPSSMGS